MLVNDTGGDQSTPVLEMISDAARWRLFQEFAKADPMRRMEIGAELDALAVVMREFQVIANEVAVSGRIERSA